MSNVAHPDKKPPTMSKEEANAAFAALTNAQEALLLLVRKPKA